MKRGEHDAYRAFEASSLHPGCTGDCADGAACNCSHSAAWRAPRQPRRPEPRRPTLPLSTRIAMWAQQHLAFVGDYRDLLAVCAILVCMGAAMGAAAALVLFR